MSPRARLTRLLIRNHLVVTAVLLVAALPAESAIQLAQPAADTEKAASCTVGRTSPEHVTADQDTVPQDRPRVAVREPMPEGKQAPGSGPAQPELCPLDLPQKPAPPRGRP